jgi:hypothetical protein
VSTFVLIRVERHVFAGAEADWALAGAATLGTAPTAQKKTFRHKLDFTVRDGRIGGAIRSNESQTGAPHIVGLYVAVGLPDGTTFN